MSIVLASSLKCTSAKAADEITGSLNKFFNNLSEGLGDAFEFIDELDDTVSDIADAMDGITTVMIDLLETKLADFISTGLMAAKNLIFNKITDPISQLIQTNSFLDTAAKPGEKLLGAFGCIGKTIKNALKKTIKNMLLNMVNNGFINPLECAVEEFIGGLTNKITSMMDGIIGPLVEPLNNLFSVVGNAFGGVKNFLLGGLNIVSKIQGLINCKGSGGECHTIEEYNLNGVVGNKSDTDAEKQNKFTKGLKNIKKGLEGFSEKIDTLTDDIGTWGIFGGSKTTREKEIARLEKEIANYERKDNEDITSVADQLNKRLNEVNGTIDFKESTLENYKENLKSRLNVDKRNDTNNPNKPLVFTNLPEADVIREEISKIEAELVTLRKRKDAIEKEIGELSTDSVLNQLKKELEEVKAMEPGAEITTNVGADLERESPDCNTGNIFKCGKPKVSIFGGGGQGAIGEVILGNFLQELDKEISQTEYQVNPSAKTSTGEVEGLGDIDNQIFKIRNQLNPLGAKIKNRKDQLVRFKDANPPRDAREITALENEIKELEEKLKTLKDQYDNLLARRAEITKEEYWNVEGGSYPEPTYEQIGGSLLDDIKTTGSIIGVDITYPGEGYTSEPIVKFEDNCEQGYGAFGKAQIDKDPNSPTFGQLIGILVYSIGENYPADAPEDSFVDRIVVENGGSGYKLTDKVGDFEICGVDDIGRITKVCTNDRAYRTLPDTSVESITGSGAILTPVMTRQRRQTGVITVIDCITPRNNIVGYVDGKEYNGPFHVHPETGQKMVGIAHTTSPHATIYNTPQESLRTGTSPTSNVGSTKVGLRSIQQLVQESESTDTPPSSPPPSSPPSSGGGGYGGY